MTNKPLLEAIEKAKEWRQLEDSYAAKVDEIMEAYMDGHLDAIQYKIELDAVEDWFDSEVDKLTGVEKC